MNLRSRKIKIRKLNDLQSDDLLSLHYSDEEIEEIHLLSDCILEILEDSYPEKIAVAALADAFLRLGLETAQTIERLNAAYLNVAFGNSKYYFRD